MLGNQWDPGDPPQVGDFDPVLDSFDPEDDFDDDFEDDYWDNDEYWDDDYLELP